MKNTMGIMYSNGDFEAWDIECSKLSDIDRAMQWCEEYLRMEEVRADLTESFDDDWAIECFDYFIDTCVRYLEKVEEGL